MIDLIKRYACEETAMDENINKMLWVLGGVGIVLVCVYFVWNILSSNADDTNAKLDNATRNPGKGNEFSGSPFGN